MAVAYHINHEQGLVTLGGSNTVDIDDARDLGRAVLQDAKMDPKLPHLIDLRGLSVTRTTAQARAFREFAIGEYAPKVQGSIAVVIDEALDEQSCAALYHMICSIDRAELFDHYDQALKWLMRREFLAS